MKSYRTYVHEDIQIKLFYSFRDVVALLRVQVRGYSQ